VAQLILTKYSSGRSIYRTLSIYPLKLSEELKFSLISINGIYYDVIVPIIAVFSYLENNFLLVKSELYEINNCLSIKYYCEQNEREESWLKIYQDDKVILDVTYKNNHEPFLDYIGGGMGEDWDVVNFAWHLAGYINKVKADPSIILFAGSN
jgi:antitoxin component YwqK of YwqJK toxin-antitoxin module